MKVTCAIHPPASQRTPFNNPNRVKDVHSVALHSWHWRKGRASPEGHFRSFPVAWNPPGLIPLLHMQCACGKRVTVDDMYY
jgi:hypothetical protein